MLCVTPWLYLLLALDVKFSKSVSTSCLLKVFQKMTESRLRMMTAYRSLYLGFYLPKGIKPGLISTQDYESLQYQAGDIAVDAQLVHFRLETSEI